MLGSKSMLPEIEQLSHNSQLIANFIIAQISICLGRKAQEVSRLSCMSETIQEQLLTINDRT